jgi:GxxExxY protein
VNGGTTENAESTEILRPVNVTTGSPENAEMRVNDVTEQIIGAAIDVHRALGPGLLESAYAACMVRELADRRVHFEAQKPLPVTYKDTHIDCGYRIDLLVERAVVVELKAVGRLEAIHEAQLLSYLKLSGCPVGLLINFNVRQLMTGVRRMVNGLPP